MHGVQKHAPDLGEGFAWGAKTCLRFGGRFCTGCINVPQIWGRLLHGVHKRLPVLRQGFEVLEWFFTDLEQGFQTLGWYVLYLRQVILIFYISASNQGQKSRPRNILSQIWVKKFRPRNNFSQFSGKFLAST